MFNANRFTLTFKFPIFRIIMYTSLPVKISTVTMMAASQIGSWASRVSFHMKTVRFAACMRM